MGQLRDTSFQNVLEASMPLQCKRTFQKVLVLTFRNFSDFWKHVEMMFSYRLYTTLEVSTLTGILRAMPKVFPLVLQPSAWCMMYTNLKAINTPVPPLLTHINHKCLCGF